ncbi:MAG: TetR/AcrR family transcriptional regulator [Clostridia bacterium]|nr:TetR/AcrR family transcriptional regulator [Clostridia bacterium]
MEHRKKADLRVIRTKKAIRAAFAQLLSEKDLVDVTVTEIAGCAQINRKTFYNYYRNTEDLISEIENEAIEAFGEVMQGVEADDILRTPEKLVRRISGVIAEDVDYFRDILVMSKNAAVFNRIADSLRERLRRLFALQDSADPLLSEILSIYVVSGSLSVYRHWIIDGWKEPREEIDAYLETLSIACAQAAMRP